MKSRLAVWLGSLALVAVTLAVATGLGLYKYGQVRAAMQAPPPPEMPIAVVVAEVTEVSYRQRATMIGTVLAPQSIMLSNEIAGTVKTMQFEPGQAVEEGQILVELDTSVEQARLESAQARRQIAQSIFQRTSEAAAAKAMTPAELDEAEAQLTQATAEVSELQAIIERKTLRAPFRGKIGLSDTHVGQFLPSGFEIASLQSLDDFVYVDFMIPQTAADSVRVGQSVTFLIRGLRVEGDIIALDSQADRQSRNLMARAKLTRMPEIDNLVPGDSVKVLIEYGPLQTTTAVPVEALRQAPMNSYVFVAEEDNAGALRANERTVNVGPTIGGKLSILSGLSPGESVVADGSFKLRNGALIAPALATDENQQQP